MSGNIVLAEEAFFIITLSLGIYGGIEYVNINIVEVWVKVKVKCTLVHALRLCTGRTVHRGSRGIALLFHDHCTRRE
jgi:hypothetical protein